MSDSWRPHGLQPGRPPGSSLHEILQARILKWVAMPSSWCRLSHLKSSPPKKAILQGFPESSAGKESICNAGDPSLILGVGKILWKRDRLPTPVFLGLPCDSAGKESTCNAGDLGSIPGLGKSPAEGKGYPLQYSGLENPMDCVVQGVTKSRTRLNDFHVHFTPPKSVRNASCKHLLDSSRALFPVSHNQSLSKRWEIVKDREAWSAAKSQTQVSD